MSASSNNKPEAPNPHRPDWNWAGRSLENFKTINKKRAEEKGVLEQLMRAKTLTEARKVIFGVKSKQRGK
jgi:hypothetical protein